MPHDQCRSQDVQSSQKPLIEDPQFMTVAEVAKLLRVTGQTVCKMIHEGKLSAKRFGRQFRIPQTCVAKIINE